MPIQLKLSAIAFLMATPLMAHDGSHSHKGYEGIVTHLIYGVLYSALAYMVYNLIAIFLKSKRDQQERSLVKVKAKRKY